MRSTLERAIAHSIMFGGHRAVDDIEISGTVTDRGPDIVVDEKVTDATVMFQPDRPNGPTTGPIALLASLEDVDEIMATKDQRTLVNGAPVALRRQRTVSQGVLVRAIRRYPDVPVYGVDVAALVLGAPDDILVLTPLTPGKKQPFTVALPGANRFTANDVVHIAGGTITPAGSFRSMEQPLMTCRAADVTLMERLGSDQSMLWAMTIDGVAVPNHVRIVGYVKNRSTPIDDAWSFAQFVLYNPCVFNPCDKFLVRIRRSDFDAASDHAAGPFVFTGHHDGMEIVVTDRPTTWDGNGPVGELVVGGLASVACLRGSDSLAIDHGPGATFGIGLVPNGFVPNGEPVTAHLEPGDGAWHRTDKGIVRLSQHA
jgi:hypothetical protein